MKITDVRLVQVEGTLTHEGEFWEERLVRPVDIYPEHRVEGVSWQPQRVAGVSCQSQQVAEDRYHLQAIYVHVDTEEGVTGLSGPISETVAYLIAQELKPLLIGQDPRAVELIWDKLYRFAVHGRKGEAMMAISALDCALWDLRGKWADAPVFRLLGGPTRETIPAYASALGYSLEPEKVRQRAQSFVREGYRATKWFFRHGSGEGREGMARNLELVRTLREAVGEEVDIMLDCWMSWDVPYTIEMAERMAKYRPRWIEEPVMPDKISSYARIRAASPVPISGGEHEYTRWGIRSLIEAGAVDVLQPDVYWAGGLTEMVKICALASAFDLPVIPHDFVVPTVHLLAAQPPAVCPILEYLIKWNEVNQFFHKDPMRPEGGVMALPTAPGLGIELDESKIEARRELTWG